MSLMTHAIMLANYCTLRPQSQSFQRSMDQAEEEAVAMGLQGSDYFSDLMLPSTLTVVQNQVVMQWQL